MTDQLSPHAVQNASLLRAIRAGGATSPGDLAQRAEILPGNVHRKLDVLESEGLIVRDPAGGKHEAQLTAAGERALLAIGVYEGDTLAASSGVVEIPLDLIDPWPGNPRTQFDAEKTEELAVSIGDKGVLQPIKLRPKGDRYEVIIGERRRRASWIAVQRGWKPADFKVPAEIRDYTDEEAEEVAGVENMQREDMHWMDEAQWYLSLSHRHSGASIERLVGGIRGKRSIQDYIKCARELTPQDVARTYLPDSDKDQLTYVRARDLVGEKKERPALELSPKLTVALLETIATGIEQANSFGAAGDLAMPEIGATIVTRFAKAPVGGPLSTLSNDRKLTTFGFEGREVVARTKITEDVHRWLTQIGFSNDPQGALWRARSAILGDMQTHAMEREGRCFTDELNGAARRADGLSALEQMRRFDEPHASPEWRGEEDEAFDPDGDDAEVEDAEPESPAYLRRLAGDYSAPASPSTAAQPASPPPPTDFGRSDFGAAGTLPTPPAAAPLALDPLPAMLEIIVIEIAHKLGAGFLKSPAGGWGVPVLADYYKDARIAQLVQGRKLLAIHPHGEKSLAVQTDAARDFLRENYGLEDEDGRVTLGDAALQSAQMQLLGAKPTGGLYSTPWLNAPAKIEPAPQDPPPQGEVAARPTEGVSAAELDAGAAVALASAEARAFASLAAATRQAVALLNQLKGRSKAPKPEEIDPTVRLAEAALEAAAPFVGTAVS